MNSLPVAEPFDWCGDTRCDCGVWDWWFGVGQNPYPVQYGAGKVEVKLYEAWDEWKTRGGSLGIQQSIEILEKLGLKEPNAGGFKEASTNFSDINQNMFFWNTSNWRLTRITLNF